MNYADRKGGTGFPDLEPPNAKQEMDGSKDSFSHCDGLNNIQCAALSETKNLADAVAQKVSSATSCDEEKSSYGHAPGFKTEAGLSNNMEKEARSGRFISFVKSNSQIFSAAAGTVITGLVTMWHAEKAVDHVFTTCEVEIAKKDSEIKDLQGISRKALDTAAEAIVANESYSKMLGLTPIDDQEAREKHKRREAVRNIASSPPFMTTLLSNTVVYYEYFSDRDMGKCTAGVIADDAVVTAKHCLTGGNETSYGYPIPSVERFNFNPAKEPSIRVVKVADNTMSKIRIGQAVDPVADTAVIVFSNPIFKGSTPLMVASDKVSVGEMAIAAKIIDSKYYTPLVGEIVKYSERNMAEVPFSAPKGHSGSPVVNERGELMGILSACAITNQEKVGTTNEEKKCYITPVRAADVKALYDEAKSKL